MELMAVAKQLVERVRDGDGTRLLDEIYDEDARSIEAWSPEGQDRETRGLDALRGKHAWWDEHMETHAMEVEGPFPHGRDKFALIYQVDATDRSNDQRFQMREVAVYTVADGKITREEFFYDRPG
ncbi:Ketosteroid isomerase-related protein [Palleronia salina]|uniref:Ketosteroid isomerase-related protein n=1 Tax=Palleronia salina TaxID=313368 RepID=A0A1M6I823_9RHOB|nr:nuclear transport factor 2 family protein [Palleronia salina]SHJ30620.1 Ketosteroid isomerase-related protein [Palleronia salina]